MSGTPWGRWVFLDDRIVAVEDASVSVLDRGLLRGEGVFEGLRTYRGVPFAVTRHLARMHHSAANCDVRLPPESRLRRAVSDVIDANGFSETRVQLTATSGPGGPGIESWGDPAPTLVAIASELQLPTGDRTVTAVTLPWVRHESSALTGLKPTSYLDHVVGKKWAMRHGADEGIWTNSSGLVTEATGSNLFIVRDGTVRTPPLDAGLLAGVTRDLLMLRCAAIGIPLVETMLTRDDVLGADEVFLTASSREAVAVRTVDGEQVGTGATPVLDRLLADFRAWVLEHPDP
jgi:branched-chain amino acid aminotransferase